MKLEQNVVESVLIRSLVLIEGHTRKEVIHYVVPPRIRVKNRKLVFEKYSQCFDDH
jgi:hypothetical protein